MRRQLYKIPFFFEIIINGFFVLFFSLNKIDKWPVQLSLPGLNTFNNLIIYLAPILVGITLITHYRQSLNVDDFVRKYIFSVIIFIAMLISCGDREFCYWLSVVHLFSTILTLTDAPTRQRSMSLVQDTWLVSVRSILKLQPAQIVIISFGLMILIGAVLLMLPISAAPGKSINVVDALFISTSATCVTGLSTLSLVDDFSIFGQIVVLCLIQIGGLGIMTLSSSMVLFLGKSLGVKEQVLMQDVLESSNSQELLQLIIDIIKFTLFIETVGAIILTYGFFNEGFEIGQSLYLGFFHSISAFCNAGMALFNNNLEDFYSSPWINLTIASLIILGGLGFAVIKEMEDVIFRRKKAINLTVHSKIVLTMTFGLILFGMVYIFFGEFLNGLDKFSLTEKLQIAFFQSVTTRTAGYNTVNLNILHTHTLYMMILLMFIGASPGSTGGGVKTTTFAILLQSIKSTLNNQNKVTLFRRTIPNTTVVKSISLFIISLMFVSFVFLILLRVENDKPFLSILFEVVSAFATVGLSMGITPMLSIAGKLIVVFLMFLGRVGPLTLVLAVSQRSQKKENINYPDGKILIG